MDQVKLTDNKNYLNLHNVQDQNQVYFETHLVSLVLQISLDQSKQP